MSRHLRLLKGTRLVSEERQGTRHHVYALRAEGVEAVAVLRRGGRAPQLLRRGGWQPR
ncbi:MAG: hypothetical protein R2702_03275 [Acidimicrobiales bacterium]